jgi:hypothetical protein
MMVYIASDSPLELKPWDKDNPSFCIEELKGDENVVRKQFTKPHVYYVGPHTGCGCGFQVWDPDPDLPDDDDDLAEAKLVEKSRRQLRDLIESLLQSCDIVELFATWSGGESDPPEITRELQPADLTGSHRAFHEEGEFILFRQ